jgi:squalene synthase HpnC
MTATDNRIEEAYAACEALTRRHYENFSIATVLLPRVIRRHMYALYAFARGVDDLGDEAPGDRLLRLGWWEQHLMAAWEKCPPPDGEAPAAFIALAQTRRELDLPIEPFRRLIEANRRDQWINRYSTFDQVLEYCTYSADPVGRLVLMIFGYHDPELWPLSDATCTALQLTNFWQDVARDFAMDRIYLPAEDRERFGVEEQDLGRCEATPALRRLIAFEVGRTREIFDRGRPLIDRVAGRFRIDLDLFTRGGEAVLDAIEAGGCDVLAARPVLSRGSKTALFGSAVLGRFRRRT